MRRAAWTVLATALVGMPVARRAAGAPPADEPPPAVSPEERALRTTLDARVNDWIRARKALVPVRCWNCAGKGKFSRLIERKNVETPCTTCRGTGRTVSEASLKSVYVSMRSPAWRLRNGETVPRDDRAGLALDAGRVERVEILDATHGVGWIFENDEGLAKPSRWVRVFEAQRNLWTWYVHDETADGPWPTPDAPEAAGPPQPIAGEQKAILDPLLAATKTTFRAGASARIGKTLVLDLVFPGAPVEAGLEEIVRDDATAISRAVYARMVADWEAIRLTFLTPVQDAAGARSVAPYARVAVAYSLYAATDFTKTSRDALVKLVIARLPLAEGVGRVWAAPAAAPPTGTPPPTGK